MCSVWLWPHEDGENVGPKVTPIKTDTLLLPTWSWPPQSWEPRAGNCSWDWPQSAWGCHRLPAGTGRGGCWTGWDSAGERTYTFKRHNTTLRFMETCRLANSRNRDVCVVRSNNRARWWHLERRPVAEGWPSHGFNSPSFVFTHIPAKRQCRGSCLKWPHWMFFIWLFTHTMHMMVKKK